MPIVKEIVEEHFQVYFWEISESEEELLQLAVLSDSEKERLTKIKVKNRKLEWLACRALINDLFEEKVVINNDDYGKPSINVEGLNISLSHSGKYVTLGISENEIGVDIERIKDKVLKLTSKFMSTDELKLLSKNKTTEYALIYWASKESLLKIYGKKDLNFCSDIAVFNMGEKSALGTFNNQKSKNPYKISFEKLDDYIFVLATEQK